MKTFSIVLLICILPFIGICQHKIFSEKDFLAVLQTYHPLMQQANIRIRMANADILAARGAFDPIANYQNGRKDFGSITYYDQQIAELKIPTWYGIDVYAGKETHEGSRLNPEKTKGDLTYMGVSIPLVQNVVMDKRRSTLKQAAIFRNLSSIEKQTVLNELTAEGLRAYWNWWEQYLQSQTMEAALSNANRRLQMVKSTYFVGERAAIDTLEAFTQVQTFQLKLNEVQTNLQKAILDLSLFLWEKNDQQIELSADVVPQQWTNINGLTLEQLLLNTATHPELLQYNYKTDALQIEKRLKFQMLLPEITLKYQQIGSTFSTTLKNEWFNNNYRYGLSFSLPLRLSAGRGEYAKAKLKIDEVRLQQVNKQAQLYIKVKQYFIELQQVHKQLALQQRLLANIDALLSAEETRFANGESSLFLINAREQKTIEARQKIIELQSKISKAQVNLLWAAGLYANE